MDNVLNKIIIGVSTIAAGLITGVGVAYLHEKRKEQAIGGKLMRVNYRFTKDFDD